MAARADIRAKQAEKPRFSRETQAASLLECGAFQKAKCSRTQSSEIARSIHAHTRAMNRLLKKARAAGLRVALKIETVVEADGRYWDVAVCGHGLGVRSAIVQWASRLRAVKIKPTEQERNM